MATFLMTLSDP